MPTIIMKYSEAAGGPSCQAQPDGQTIARGYTRQNTTPNAIRAICNSLRRDMSIPSVSERSAFFRSKSNTYLFTKPSCTEVRFGVYASRNQTVRNPPPQAFECHAAPIA